MIISSHFHFLEIYCLGEYGIIIKFKPLERGYLLYYSSHCYYPPLIMFYSERFVSRRLLLLLALRAVVVKYVIDANPYTDLCVAASQRDCKLWSYPL